MLRALWFRFDHALLSTKIYRLSWNYCLQLNIHGISWTYLLRIEKMLFLKLLNLVWILYIFANLEIDMGWRMKQISNAVAILSIYLLYDRGAFRNAPKYHKLRFSGIWGNNDISNDRHSLFQRHCSLGPLPCAIPGVGDPASHHIIRWKQFYNVT